MFGFLSAEDLALSAQACRYLASVSSQDELWKRLYCARCCVTMHGYNVSMLVFKQIPISLAHRTTLSSHMTFVPSVANLCTYQAVQLRTAEIIAFTAKQDLRMLHCGSETHCLLELLLQSCWPPSSLVGAVIQLISSGRLEAPGCLCGRTGPLSPHSVLNGKCSHILSYVLSCYVTSCCCLHHSKLCDQASTCLYLQLQALSELCAGGQMPALSLI